MFFLPGTDLFVFVFFCFWSIVSCLFCFAWKDSSFKWSIMCCAESKTLLSHSQLHCEKRALAYLCCERAFEDCSAVDWFRGCLWRWQRCLRLVLGSWNSSLMTAIVSAFSALLVYTTVSICAPRQWSTSRKTSNRSLHEITFHSLNYQCWWVFCVWLASLGSIQMDVVDSVRNQVPSYRIRIAEY